MRISFVSNQTIYALAAAATCAGGRVVVETGCPRSFDGWATDPRSRSVGAMKSRPIDLRVPH
jgi:hypothetical protein